MLVITENMLSAPDALGYRHYRLTGNITDGIRLSDNVMDNVWLDGGGYRVIDTGPVDNFGIYSSGNSNLVIANFAAIEGFRHSVYLLDADNTKISWVTARDSSLNGFTVDGDNVSIANTRVFDIGGDPDYFPAASMGMALYGSNITVANSSVWNVHGRTESVGIGFNSYGTFGNSILNTSINGIDGTGWTFGVWSNSDDTFIYNTYIHDFDQGVGATEVAEVEWSTIENVGKIGQITDGGLNTLSPQTPDNNLYVMGDQFSNRLVAGSGDNIVFGDSGADTLTGGLGADTFLFVATSQTFDVITDWQQGIDQIGVARWGFESNNLQIGVFATGGDPTWYWNQYEHTLWYDVDGYGGEAGDLLAYIPGAPTLGPGQGSMEWV